jgi:hypothetical protein
MAAITVTATNFRLSSDSTIKTAQAGEAVTAFQLLYRKQLDSKVWLAVNSTEAEADFFGIASTPAAADGYLCYVPATAGISVESAGTPFTKGSTYVIGDVAGQMMDAADAASGDWVTIAAVATSTSKIKIVNSQSGISV